MSPHEGSASELLDAAQLTGLLPPHIWLGLVTVAQVATGLGLSAAVQKRLPRLVEQAEAFVSKLLQDLAAVP